MRRRKRTELFKTNLSTFLAYSKRATGPINRPSRYPQFAHEIAAFYTRLKSMKVPFPSFVPHGGDCDFEPHLRFLEAINANFDSYDLGPVQKNG